MCECRDPGELFEKKFSGSLSKIMDTSGIEPEASSMPRKRSTPDLRALKCSTIIDDICYKSIGGTRQPGQKEHAATHPRIRAAFAGIRAAFAAVTLARARRRKCALSDRPTVQPISLIMSTSISTRDIFMRPPSSLTPRRRAPVPRCRLVFSSYHHDEDSKPPS
jgi:hypothetical protein